MDPVRHTVMLSLLTNRSKWDLWSLNIHTIGEPMAEETQKQTVSLQELMVSTLAMTDAAVKLLIQKGVFTDARSSKRRSE
jgi:hypothetical protein